MRIMILGSCSGTEPQAGRHHTSWLLECPDGLFWFDTGENCAYRAHLEGVDLLRTRGIFLSHPHLDHVAGLPYLLWTIQKMCYVKNVHTPFAIELHTPVPEQIAGITQMLEAASEWRFDFTLNVHRVADGVIAERPLRVTAQHNRHMDREETVARWHSFSYRIECENKVIVSSGDVASITELDNWTRDCDLLFMETGHHDPVKVCEHLAARQSRIRRLVFLHHGRAMLRDAETLMKQCAPLLPCPVEAAYDGMTIAL